MHIAVLGAGLQGACAALALAAAGHRIDLYERDLSALSRASLHNEGKLHLGYVYAGDPTLRTARLMVAGALSFGPLLHRWIGPELAALPRSSPFTYLVHRRSLVTIDAVAAHLDACRALAAAHGAGKCDYLSVDYLTPSQRLDPRELARQFNPDEIAAAFLTPEIGIDPAALAALVRARLAAEPRIRLIFGAVVDAVARREPRIEVLFTHVGAPHRRSYDHVVNALWDGRLAVDATLGIVPRRGWLHRLRYGVRVGEGALAAPLPAVTIVLGPFGDVVGYGNSAGWLSWYPIGMVEKSDALLPPAWPEIVPEAAAIRIGVVAALGAIVPAVADAQAAIVATADVRGGYVFAWGHSGSDIDDPRSELHARDDAGIASYGRYHSINTGKLTTAPLFARQLVERIGGG